MSECILNIQLMQRPMKGGSKRVIDRIGAKRRKETEQSGQVKVQGLPAWDVVSKRIDCSTCGPTFYSLPS